MCNNEEDYGGLYLGGKSGKVMFKEEDYGGLRVKKDLSNLSSWTADEKYELIRLKTVFATIVTVLGMLAVAAIVVVCG